MQSGGQSPSVADVSGLEHGGSSEARVSEEGVESEFVVGEFDEFTEPHLAFVGPSSMRSAASPAAPGQNIMCAPLGLKFKAGEMLVMRKLQNLLLLERHQGPPHRSSRRFHIALQCKSHCPPSSIVARHRRQFRAGTIIITIVDAVVGAALRILCDAHRNRNCTCHRLCGRRSTDHMLSRRASAALSFLIMIAILCALPFGS